MATARDLTYTDKELADASAPSGGGGGAYAAIEVPGDFSAILRRVDDYDKRDAGKTHGWVFYYGVDGGGGEAEFRVWLSFGGNASWKMIEVLAAHGIQMEPGVKINIDPESLINDEVGVHVDYPRDKVTNNPTSTYREIRQVFPLADAPLPVESVVEEAPTL